MRMELKQNMKLSQEMRLTPMMIQSMEILQLQIQELSARIEQEKMENPVLDLGEDADNEPAQEDSSEEQERAEEGLDETLSRVNEMISRYQDPDERPSYSGGGDDRDGKLDALANTAGPEPDLMKHLLAQVHLLNLTEQENTIAEHIVMDLDHRGFVNASSQVIAETLAVDEDLQVSEEEVDDVLHYIQTRLDPPGVCARNITECLLLQIDTEDPDNKLLIEIIENHLEDVQKNRLPFVARALNVELEDLKHEMKKMHALKPHPGALFGGETGSRIHPDVIIEETEGRFEVRLEQERLPEIRISPRYREMLIANDGDKETLKYVRQKIDAAQWLIDAILQRRQTITSVVEEMVAVQGDFLRHGVEKLKPLRMQDIAEKVGVHVSTVSRAISGKYAQSPQGVIALKTFFTGGTRSEDGGTESLKALQLKVKKIIDEEDKAKPLNDDQIVLKLSEQGIKMARRTVSKYRKILGIQSARQRKVF